MPKTILPNPRVSPRFAGLTTFGRYPRLEDVTPDNKPIDWCVYGAPHDTGVTYRPGARFGPRAVREASQYLKRFHLEHRVDVCDVLSLCDAGDAPVKPYELKGTLDAIADWAIGLGRETNRPVSKQPTAASRLLAIGGDHSIAYANLKATHERRGRPAGGLAVVHFDAHLDTVDQVWGHPWGHASPFIRAIEDGLIDAKSMISIGVRGPLNSGDDLRFATDHGVQIVTIEQWRIEGPKKLASFVNKLGEREVYLTFDVDCVDPAFAPGTGTPCPGGLSSSEALQALRMLKGVHLAGADVVEVLPDRDVSGNTAFLAAHVVFEILALDAVIRAPKPEVGRKRRTKPIADDEEV